MGYQGEDCSLPEITQAAVLGCPFRLVRNQWLLLQPTEGLWDLNTMLRCWKTCLTNVISQSKPASVLPENFLTCRVSFSSFLQYILIIYFLLPQLLPEPSHFSASALPDHNPPPKTRIRTNYQNVTSFFFYSLPSSFLPSLSPLSFFSLLFWFDLGFL